LESISLIEKIVRRAAPGRSPSFTEAQVLKALELISSGPGVGRKRLGDLLGLNEGVTRTLLRHLRETDLIEVTRRGITLRQEGERLLAALNTFISGGTEVPRSPLTIGPQNFVVLVRGVGQHIRSGVEQRDSALKAGALGATTLVFDGERLTLPGMQELAPKAEEVYDLLLSRLKPRKGDVIVIGTAEDTLSAELGAKTAALELLKSMK
jgi:predicted transcriptional regulator